MRIKFAMHLYSLIPALLVLVMAWASHWLFDLLRFGHCQDWSALPPAPGSFSQVAGVLPNRLYLQAAGEQGCCLDAGHWSACELPSDLSAPVEAPLVWAGSWASLPDGPGLVDLARGGSWVQVRYIARVENGSLWSCQTNLNAELEAMLASGQIVWLAIPPGLGGLGAWAFFSIVASEGQPTFWDFFGRGRRVK